MPPSTAVKKSSEFDPGTFLATIGEGRKILAITKKQAIFAQGDDADAVFYVQKGKVRLTVVSKIGKEATIAIVNQGNFFGEGSLAGQPLRGRSCRPAFQLQRKAAGPRVAVARAFWQGRHSGNCSSQDQPGNSGRDGRDNSFARQLLYEPLPEAGLHSLRRRLRRRAAGP